MLAALEKALEGAAGEWHVRHVNAADRAVEALAQYPAHVVLARLGDATAAYAQLFGEVIRVCPSAMRLAMLEDDAQGSARLPTAIPLAHQCLPARAEAHSAAQVLAAAASVAERSADNPPLQTLLCNLREVPSPPALYFDIREQLQARDGTVANMASIAERDQALVARVLKVANSGFYALPRTVNDIAAAISMLGSEALLSLVLSSHLYGGLPPPGLNLDVLWRHALQVSKLARGIALADGGSRTQQNSAGVAGLLHDVGLIVLLHNETARYQPLWRQAAGDEACLIELERAHYGVHHGELGALVLRLWTLPPEITDAVEHSHDTSELDLPCVSRAVLAGDWLAGAGSVTDTGDVDPDAIPAALGVVSAPTFMHWQTLRGDVAGAAY